MGSIWFLMCNQHDVTEAVGVEAAYGRQIPGQDFAAPCLQSLDEMTESLFGVVVDFFQFHCFFLSCRFRPVFVLHLSDSGQKQTER
jgi:hypothetical protein